jgi:hypothetical protein
MGQNKLIFWEDKIRPILGKNKGLAKTLKTKLKNINLKERKKSWAKEKMAVAYRAGLILEKIPSVVFVGVTGSVASDWPKKEDDVDLLIISTNGRLWLNRIIIMLGLKLAGFELRKKNVEKTNSLCLNMWLEERSLTIEKSRRSLLTAIDLVWLKPVVNKRNYWQKFLISNKWAEKYVKMNIKYSQEKREKAQEKRRGILEIVNYLAYKIQYLYMRKKIKKEIVDLDRAYFHPKGKIPFDRI